MAETKINASRLLAYAVVAIFALNFLCIIDVPYIQDIDYQHLATTGGAQQQVGDYVDVERTIDFALTDQYAGSALASKSIVVYRGAVPVETATSGSDGTIATAMTYRSGEQIAVFIDDGNAHYWIPITVPKMLRSTAEATTASIYVPLKGWTANTYTDLCVISGTGTAYADAAEFNITSNSSSTITYSWAGVTDNRGILSAGFDDPLTVARGAGVGAITTDPVYNVDPQLCLFIVANTTNLVIDNMDGSYIAGTSKVYYKVLPCTDFIKYKVGNDYLRSGNGQVLCPLDGSGVTANCSIQLYIFAYADPSYALSHAASGSTATAYGPRAVQMMETSLVGFV